jgi:hypothetical protein
VELVKIDQGANFTQQITPVGLPLLTAIFTKMFKPTPTSGQTKSGVLPRYFVQDKLTNKVAETDKQSYDQAEKIQTIGSAFGRIDWYVDNHPKVCAETLKLGIPTLVVASPYIGLPEWDTLNRVKGWDSLVDEMDSQALKSAKKTWREV